MKFLTTVTTLLFSIGCLFAQVSNVRMQQRTDGTFMVDIYYDFSNPNGYDTEIAVMASGDNGATWELACSISNQTGDVGEDISAGTDKHIVWDFYADNPNTSGSQFKVRVLYYFFSTMTGNDGTVYKTIKIGDQWWMAENLSETQYRDGTAIEEETDEDAWVYAGEAGDARRCVYNNDEDDAETYGYLYNWYIVDPNNSYEIAPTGWHVATDDDWLALELALGMSESEVNTYNGYRGTNEGSKLVGRKDLWQDDVLVNDDHFNASRFSAVPGGCRTSSHGQFIDRGDRASFWTASSYGSSDALIRTFFFTRSDIGRLGDDKAIGYSVRLVKD